MGCEAENETCKKTFANWCVDTKMMRATKPDALFIHCLRTVGKKSKPM